MSTPRLVPAILVSAILLLVGVDRFMVIALAQSNRTPPPPGGAFYPPYRPIGPPPFCDRANPPPPGGAFTAGGDKARGGDSRARVREAQPPATDTPAQVDDASRFASAWSMLKNYANARPVACREVTPRCDAVLDEFSSLMTAEQLLDVASFANRCDATPTARRALQIVIDRFPGTSHATLAEAQQRRLPRR